MPAETRGTKTIAIWQQTRSGFFGERDGVAPAATSTALEALTATGALLFASSPVLSLVHLVHDVISHASAPVSSKVSVEKTSPRQRGRRKFVRMDQVRQNLQTVHPSPAWPAEVSASVSGENPPARTIRRHGISNGIFHRMPFNTMFHNTMSHQQEIAVLSHAASLLCAYKGEQKAI
jgi:hypothetical protein